MVIRAYQGREFTVTLESSVSSTNYGWCLTSMPEEVVLASICFEPNGQKLFGKPARQVFTFLALGYSLDIKPLEFQEICFHDTRQTGKKVRIALNVIPYNTSDTDDDSLDAFVEYSENSAKLVSSVSNIRVAYGIPSVYADEDVTIDKYGMPCIENALTLEKYGVPCVVKYGIACSENNSMLVKYGSPCVVDYGVACSENDSMIVKYGIPCANNDSTIVKYGAPCTK